MVFKIIAAIQTLQTGRLPRQTSTEDLLSSDIGHVGNTEVVMLSIIILYLHTRTSKLSNV